MPLEELDRPLEPVRRGRRRSRGVFSRTPASSTRAGVEHVDRLPFSSSFTAVEDGDRRDEVGDDEDPPALPRRTATSPDISSTRSACRNVGLEIPSSPPARSRSGACRRCEARRSTASVRCRSRLERPRGREPAPPRTSEQTPAQFRRVRAALTRAPDRFRLTPKRNAVSLRWCRSFRSSNRTSDA